MKTPRPTYALLAAAMLALGACAQDPQPVPQPAPTPAKRPAPSPTQKPAAPSRHTPFDDLLQNYVHEGVVEYPEIRKHHAGTLRDYLTVLARTDASKLGKNARYAFYINLYNASMIQAVLDHTAKDKRWTPAADKFAVFKEKRVRTSKGTITLDHLEHEILRKQFQDHRVHVALVCGAQSCPPLRSAAFEGKDLDKTLDARWRKFLRDGSRNRIDKQNKTVHLSKLFEWFADDFGKEAGIRHLLQKEFGNDVSRYRIAYLEYSWKLNDRAPKK